MTPRGIQINLQSFIFPLPAELAQRLAGFNATAATVERMRETLAEKMHALQGADLADTGLEEKAQEVRRLRVQSLQKELALRGQQDGLLEEAEAAREQAYRHAIAARQKILATLQAALEKLGFVAPDGSAEGQERFWHHLLAVHPKVQAAQEQESNVHQFAGWIADGRKANGEFMDEVGELLRNLRQRMLKDLSV